MYGRFRQEKRNVEFIGIGLLDGELAIREFVARHRLTFPNAYDANGAVARQFGFTRQPYWA